MKSVADIRARLQELLPSAFYELPPEEVPRGHEDAVPLWIPSDQDLALDPPELSGADTQALTSDPQPSLEELFEFGAEIDKGRLVQALGGTAGESIRKSVAVQGVDALAWYVTFHAQGLQWGIYIPVTSLVYFALDVFGGLQTDASTALKVAFRALHQHELFHFATDYMCTQLEAITAQPCHRKGRALRDRRLGYTLLEEELANGCMLRALRRGPSSLRVSGRTLALRSFVGRQPDGYRDGARRVLDRAFDVGCEELLWAYLSCIEYDTRGFDSINLTHLYPLRPTVDWRYCPVHIIHDERRLSLPLVDILRFEKVERIEETAKFVKELRKLPRHIVAAWQEVKARLALSTAGLGLDFKLWARRNGGRVYSVRLSYNHRAHLRYVQTERRWYAVEVGSHGKMGHG